MHACARRSGLNYSKPGGGSIWVHNASIWTKGQKQTKNVNNSENEGGIRLQEYHNPSLFDHSLYSFQNQVRYQCIKFTARICFLYKKKYKRSNFPRSPLERERGWLKERGSNGHCVSNEPTELSCCWKAFIGWTCASRGSSYRWNTNERSSNSSLSPDISCCQALCKRPKAVKGKGNL